MARLPNQLRPTDSFDCTPTLGGPSSRRPHVPNRLTRRPPARRASPAPPAKFLAKKCQSRPQIGRGTLKFWPRWSRHGVGFGNIIEVWRTSRLTSWIQRTPLMPDTVVELGKVDWKRIFPWVRLFRVFRTAIDLRMLTLSCVALVALSVGDWIFTRLPFAAAAKSSPESRVAYTWHRPAAENPLDLPTKVVHNPWVRSSAWLRVGKACFSRRERCWNRPASFCCPTRAGAKRPSRGRGSCGRCVSGRSWAER